MTRVRMRMMLAVLWIAAAGTQAAQQSRTMTERAYVMTASSALEGACYDTLREEMTLFFRNGTAYRYRAVPAPVFHAFLRTDSPGRFFHEQIRGRYPSRRLSEDALTAMIERHDGKTGW